MPQEQLKRALDLIATLPSTPELRREEIKLQVELITPLLHVRDYAAPETRAAVERAHLLIEQSDALGEPPDDPLLLFSVLYGFWVANLVAFNGDVLLELRLMGLSLLHAGKIEEGRVLRWFFKRTGQPLYQDWIVDLVKRLSAHLPITLLVKLGLANVLRPHTHNWKKSRDAIKEYVNEQNAHHEKALNLQDLVEMAQHEASRLTTQ